METNSSIRIKCGIIDGSLSDTPQSNNFKLRKCGSLCWEGGNGKRRAFWLDNFDFILDS